MKKSLFLIVLINIVFSKRISNENNITNLLSEKNLNSHEENLFEDEEYEEIEIERNEKLEIMKNTSYLFTIKNKSNVYFYESEIENIFQFKNGTFCNKICFINDQEIIVNPFKNLKNNINITINAYTIFIESFKNELFDLEEEKIFFYQNNIEQVLYLNSYHTSLKCYLGEYKDGITPLDISFRNEKFFTPILGDISILTPNVIYIVIMESINANFNIFSYMYFDTLYNNYEQDIVISNNKYLFLYLKEGVKYKLKFENNLEMLVKLSKKTINSSIEIKSENNNDKNDLTLNYSSQYYFIIEKGETKELTFIAKGKDSLIEFSYKLENFNAISISEESSTYDLEKGNNLLKFSDNFNETEFLNILLESEENFELNVYSGFSLESYVYYSESNIQINKNNRNKYLIQFIIPFEEQENIENFNVLIKSDKNIKMTITKSLLYENLLEKIPEFKCNSILENIISILNKTYIYTDIIQNPPQPENYPDYFVKFNLLKELKEIPRNNRNKYDFYIDIKKVLGKLRDFHLSIVAIEGWEYIDFLNSFICYPFAYLIKKDSKNVPKVYMRLIEWVLNEYDEDVQNFLKENQNNPILSINGIDPFDFIQNYANEIYACKNEHCSFVSKYISYGFYLPSMPLKKEDISNIKLQFGDEKEKIIDFKFMLVSHNEIKKNKNNLKEEKKKSKKFPIKGLEYKHFDSTNDIKWDYNDIKNDYFKCRVDKVNKVNVFVQSSFNYELWDEFVYAMDLFYNCSELFYSNDYPIIGIENHNGGGFGILGVYLSQLLQINVDFQVFIAIKPNNHTISFINEDEDPDNKGINLTTCENVDKNILYQSIKDYYGENVYHERTPVYSLINKTERERFENDRKKLLEKNKKTKKPTDIIIFTDGYSYSTTCILIKGLQDVGGAIIVGYNGNPKIEKEKFDASQAPSPVFSFYNEPEIENLQKLGYSFNQGTFGETFGFNYMSENPTPREYILNPVDERVDIYSSYDDSLYEQFIEKAKEIFDKYNNKKECNPKNKLLTLMDDKCKNINKKNVHGGFECNDDGKWSDNCKPFYCDFGYFYNHYLKECVRDNCTTVPENDDDDDDSKSSAMKIILIVVGIILVVVVIVFILFKFIIKKKVNKEKIEKLSLNL